MTLSISDPPSSWHRTLPIPTPLLPNAVPDSLAHRSSSVLEYHISRDQPLPTTSEEGNGRRSTVPNIPYHHIPQATPLGPAEAHTSNLHIDCANESLSRKRDAAVMVEDQTSAASSPNSTSPAEDKCQFCLCHPNLKIPRPRNAFILYRQHQQAGVLAQHPGLSNPEISKIVGEQWQQLSPEAKSEWKLLAEDEKVRHHQQYPDYRFQPRRNGRYSSSAPISASLSGGTVGPEGNCLKCGGKIMAPPTTPYTAFTPITPHPMVGFGMPPQPQLTYALTAAQGQRPGQHRMVSPPQTAPPRTYWEFVGSQPPPRPDLRPRYVDQVPSNIPTTDGHDPKRRRFNGNGVYIPTHESYPEQLYQRSPHNAQFARHEASPMPPGTRSAMAPPSRTMYPGPLSAPRLQPARPPQPQHNRDLSLTLPPLKTSASQPRPAVTMQNQKTGMEAMIMSIPVLNKVKVLSQISPCLAAPGVGSPSPEIRGMILAVEGLDVTAVSSMANSLAEQLEREGNFAVRIFGGPDPHAALTNSGRRRESSTSPDKTADSLTTEVYLNTIIKWHKISQEMIEYITTKPEKASETTSSEATRNRSVTMTDTQTVEERSESTMRSTPYRMPSIDDTIANAVNIAQAIAHKTADFSEISPRTILKTADLSLNTPAAARIPTPVPAPQFNPPFFTNPDTTNSTTPFTRIPAAALMAPPPPPPPASSAPRSSPPPLPPPSSPAKPAILKPNAIPIALVPHYQLTTVDASSIAMPITDAYSPHAHWQWLGTLWRGCVGPDVTVVIQGRDDDETPTTSSENGNGNLIPKGTVSGSKDGRNGSGVGKKDTAMSNTSNSVATAAAAPDVEVRLLDFRAVVVRTNAEGVIESEHWEKAKRRVGFEVAEFLRR